jgi:hypothetical protein
VLSTIACAALVCLVALALGQTVLGLCGSRQWSWLAPAIGIAVMMIIAVPALHVPGRSMTMAVVLLVAVLGALAYLATHRAQLPPLAGLLAGLPVFLLALLPFAAAGHAGTLGMAFNNDMASHLIWAEGYRSEAVAAVNPLASSYPLGPHALVAALAEGLGIEVDLAFAGVTMSLTVLLGWTALGALRSPRWWGPFVTAPLVGMTFLVAGYYGQGSFKEVLLAVLIVAFTTYLAAPTPLDRRLRWAPVALLLAGALSVYGHTGLVWPLPFLGIWVVGVSVRRFVTTRSARGVVDRWRAELLPVSVGAGVLLVATAPQLPRIARFISDNAGTNLTGIPSDSLGNLAGPLPLWEAFGIWDSADYRVAGPTPFENGMWTAFVVGLVVIGVAWSLRGGEWMLPAATVSTLLVWLVTDRIQSPYVAAKALVLLAPLLMILAVRPLAERDTSTRRMPSWWLLAAPALAAVLVVKVVGSSWDALRYSNVGPTAHTREIQSLRPLLGGRPTLYLGNDDFTRWLFADVPVQSPVIAFPSLVVRPEKPWEYGRNYDIDSLDSATLNRFDWIVAPRDAAASTPPRQLELARQTPSFDVYRRTARIPERRVLAEGEAAALPLDCGTPQGRAIVRAGGVAAVRDAVVSVPGPVLAPGTTATVELPLTPGRWDLVAPYGGPRPIAVTAPGLSTTLPGNLARPGPRWPIGRITVARARAVPVTLRPTSEWLTPKSALTYVTSVIAVPVDTETVVPIAAACGKLVDWYRPTLGRSRLGPGRGVSASG